MEGKESEDPTKFLNDYTKKATKQLKDLTDMMMKTNSIKEEEKIFAKFGNINVVLHRMSNGSTVVEYQNKEDQNKHFDSLRK